MFRIKLKYLLGWILIIIILVICLFQIKNNDYYANNLRLYGNINNFTKKDLVLYDHSYPLIFIGGIPRSGTTLMRYSIYS